MAALPPVLSPALDHASERFRSNAEAMRERLRQLHQEEEKLRLGGGRSAIERQHQKSRLTARERIAALIDPSTSFDEIGLHAAWEMYQEWGGAPAAGVVCGLGRVCGRLVMIDHRQ